MAYRNSRAIILLFILLDLERFALFQNRADVRSMHR